MIEEKLYVSPEKLAYVYQKLKKQIAELNATSTIILSSSMNRDEIVSAINNAPKGTAFDLQTNLELYDTEVSFPEQSLIYSSTGKKTIYFGYSDESINDESCWNNSWYLTFGSFSTIYDISVNFTDNATASVGVVFGEGCNVTNCYFNGYEPFSWGTNCNFVNCGLSYYIYNLSVGGSYINCNLDYGNAYDGVDCRGVNLINCSSNEFYISKDNGEQLTAKIKALNPDMNIVDEYGNPVEGLYATRDYVDTIIGTALEGEY